MKDIKGYEQKYAITENGRLWSYLTNQWLKPFDKNGYDRVELQGTGYLVHRLVAETYIPNPDHKDTVDHIDRNRKNNHVNNLRWATSKEQSTNVFQNQQYNHGFIVLRAINMYDKDTHKFIRRFESAAEAAEVLNMPSLRKNICKVCSDQRKSTGGYYWQYAN